MTGIVEVETFDRVISAIGIVAVVVLLVIDPLNVRRLVKPDGPGKTVLEGGDGATVPIDDSNLLVLAIREDDAAAIMGHERLTVIVSGADQSLFRSDVGIKNDKLKGVGVAKDASVVRAEIPLPC